MERVEITDVELNSFVTAVHTRFGIDFSGYEKKSLKRGLARLMMRHAMQTMIDLWRKMLMDKSMLVLYIDELLVNLTEFFRNNELWVKLKEDILYKLALKERLDIWHAGCSTGEEIYSHTITLKERFMLHRAHILATDLSSKALAKAIEGRYHNLIWDKYVKAYKTFNPTGDPTKYFTQEEKDFEVNSQLKKNIHFQRHNLVQDATEGKYDIIFCRNVMIYFDDKLKMKVMKKLHGALKKDGFLIIGYYDMLPEEIKEWFQLYCPTTRIYTKKN